MYGPELSKTTLGGSQEAIAAVVGNGTERMPGFKYTYKPDQISAIAAYVVTLAPGHQGDGK
jgi:mono/diheme cytochrome c family protein